MTRSTPDPAAPDAPVRYTRDDEGVAWLTLNRPDLRNSMTPELLDGFRAAVARAREDADLRCLVVTGTGSCFSAGANLNAALQDDSAGPLSHQRSFAMYEPFLEITRVEVPVIAALNGHAVGGGFGLSLLCDVRIANEDAKYGANFARLGFHSGLGIAWILPRLVGVSRAAELLFTGRTIRGREAEAIGLVSAAVPEADVAPRAAALAAEIARAAPLAVRGMKRSLYRFLSWDVAGAAWEEAYAQAATLATEDAREGVAALLEKRPPRFVGR